MKTGTRQLAVAFFFAFLSFPACNKEAKFSIQPAEEKRTSISKDLTAITAAPLIDIYGAWHAGNDLCTWGTVRTESEFDSKNHWLIDRGDGRPSVNVVVLSFVHPLKLLNRANDASTANGIPKGMNATIINYFKSRGVRVMLSIGGITYVDAWDQALAQNATQLGWIAADEANRLGVGIEIDYEQNRNPKLDSLTSFINAYRSRIPYDVTGNNHAARLTIDLAAGDRYLIDICRKATAEWLNTSNPVLDYANAMVPARQPSASAAIANWQEHIDGKPQYGPPIPALAPAKFTGGLFLVGSKPIAECTNFASSLQKSTASFVQTVQPKGAGTSAGMLGYMFWAAECPGTRSVCTTPPNSCQGGVGGGATYFNIAIPMLSLRQQ
ncbi:MAG TPA: hypothetical protein VLC28_02700 [Flavitalea sp.]|nr:hypothetical protein [Flavitalea sp.]